jgi:hypothetical protein
MRMMKYKYTKALVVGGTKQFIRRQDAGSEGNKIAVTNHSLNGLIHKLQPQKLQDTKN